MSAPGFWEIVALAVLALLIFGPEKLPGIARTAGKTIGALKREAQSTMDELKRAAELDELRAARKELSDTITEIEHQADVSAEVSATSGVAAGSAVASDASAPPPFDPDAT
jgi:sec-independent protein translocase protein TatB